MTFPELLDWQWSDYPEKHRNRVNLLIHIVAVPLFWLGAIQIVGTLLLLLIGVPGAFSMLVWALIFMGGSLFAQGRGHAMEATAPEKFANRGQAAQRILAEQFVTFPRFVVTGGWLQNLKGAA